MTTASKRKRPSVIVKKSPSEEPDITGVRKKVEQHYPHLWPAVEAGLAVCATLLLKDNANPTALIYIGPASAGKTTVASMFQETILEGQKHEPTKLVYRSDQFSAASFVSQSATNAREDLPEVDLLPRIRHKVLLTPDLATMFRGNHDDLTERFSTITRVLDGQGFTRDSGTHGQRGYTGDYLFAWLGCTTPFTDGIWNLMATLGSRLFFFSLDSVSDPTEDDLVQSMIKCASYQQMLKECQQCVQEFLEALFAKHRGVRTVQWNQKTTPKPVAQAIARLARLIAIMRTQIVNGQQGPVQPESAHRATAVLHNIARGHAIIHGRTRLNNEDLPLIARIALSSMPKERRAVLEAFAKHSGKPLSVIDVSEAASVSDNTARKIMREFDRLQIAHYDQNGMGKASPLTLNSEWDGKDDMWELIGEIATSQKSGDVFEEDKKADPLDW